MNIVRATMAAVPTLSSALSSTSVLTTPVVVSTSCVSKRKSRRNVGISSRSSAWCRENDRSSSSCSSSSRWRRRLGNLATSHLAVSSYGTTTAVCLTLVLAVLTVPCLANDPFQTEEKSRRYVTQDELDARSFQGNRSHVDHFKLLQRDGDSLLIGARNIVYNISLHDLKENEEMRIEWYSTDIDSNMCFSKGKSVEECQNYIRVLAKKSEGEYLVCGTNAYKPLCRHYSLQANGSFHYNEVKGKGICPFDPKHNSTFVFADGELYSGTVADFQGTNPLVFRDPLKTDHNELIQLNAPNFVHSFEYKDFVFFFLRETAVEYMNCGKRVYSRVARVCKGDRGGEQQRLMMAWTSFLKSRLNCSVPGEFPFYFDEIQAATDIVMGQYGGEKSDIMYAVFTTPANSIPGSAVCAFSMRAILDTFEGAFKQQEDIYSNWLPFPSSKVPEPRPGSCVNDSQTLPENIINFVKAHPLMDEPVPAFFGEPLIIKASFNYRFTKIAVDPQVPLISGDSGEAVDVLFIATDIGTVLKTINAQAPHSFREIDPVIIEEIQLFDEPTSIINLQIAKGKLIIITDDEVKSIEVQRCHKVFSCSECVHLRDPYCAWDEGRGQCVYVSSQPSTVILGPIFQNVTSGQHYQCPYSGDNEVYVPTSKIQTTGPMDHSTLVSYEDEDFSTPDNNNIPPLNPNQNVINNNIPGSEMGNPRRDPSVGVHKDKALPNDILVGIHAGREDVLVAYAEAGLTTGPVVGASLEGPPIYSAETLAVAVTTACVAALVIGFISGFLFSRKCRGDDYSNTYSDTPHLDSKLKRDNLNSPADPNMYMANNKHINNLVTNYNPKNINGKSNTNTTTDSKLLKPAKCAYI
ncbi:semaphorin-1A-like isoform X3 [Oratosquilla oratoria]|uniref:semaphorin-1A-like isoform X3 n=1 Tax=Oratosquilla oratoria TaxID=337810 RepID=UPI003F75E27F